MSGQLPPPPLPKQPSGSILGTPRPQPTRYRRGLIMAFVIGAALFFSLALVYGFMGTGKQTKSAGNDQDQNPSYNTQNMPQVGSFPNSYASLTAPQPPPKPVPAPAPQTPLAPVAPAPPPPIAPTPGYQAPTPAQEEAEKASQSNIFFQSTQDPALQSEQADNPASTLSPTAIMDQTSTSANGSQAAPTVPADADQSLESEKDAFVNQNQKPSTNDYTGTAEQAPLSPYEVQAGTVIPAALLTAVNSDLPGDVTAQVTENVYDTATGAYLLIPQGSRLYGKYDSLISYGQNRALIIWDRLLLPNGNSIDLDGMNGTDTTGAAGLQDQVNSHIPGLLAALGAASLFSIGPSLALNLTEPSSGSGNTNVFTSPAQTLGQNINNVGQEFVSKELNRPNTIKIRAGWPLRVLVNKDMIMEAYSQ